MIGVAVPDRVETDLAAGAIACPGCGGALRPRRARCSACRATHVLLPGTVCYRGAPTRPR